MMPRNLKFKVLQNSTCRLTGEVGILRLSLAFVLAVFLFRSVLEFAIADETSPSEQEIKINELTVRYRDTVEAYRTKEREFTIAKQQYEQLQTLASLEKAVQSTRSAYVVRVETLSVYLELLQAIIEDAQGIDPVTKQRTLEKILLQLEALQRHDAKIDKAIDRVAINEVSNEFTLMTEDVEATVYQAQSIIIMGKMQTAYFTAEMIRNEIVEEKEGEELSPLEESEQQRALDEVDRTLKSISQSITSIEALTQEESYEHTAGSYNGLLKRFSEPYSSLKQVVSFFKELTES